MNIKEVSYQAVGGKVRLVGDFNDALVPIGRGTIYNPDGTRYEGEWSGKRCFAWAHGEGVYYDAQGRKELEGHFDNGNLYGRGKIYDQGRLFIDGTIYLRDGKLLPGSCGKRYAKSGAYYEGELSTDEEGYIRSHGEGATYRPDGTKEFQGHFEYGRYHGKGKLYDKRGNLYVEGMFYSDEQGNFLEGSYGTVYDNGRHKVRFVNGEWKYVDGGGSSRRGSGDVDLSAWSDDSGYDSSGISSGGSDDSGCGFKSCLWWILLIAGAIWALVHFGFISISKSKKDDPPKEQTEQVEKSAKPKKKGGKGKKNRQAEPAEDPNASTGFHLETGQPAQAEPAGSQSGGTGFHLDPVDEVPAN